MDSNNVNGSNINQHDSDKLYRLDSLLYAMDFFSQKFDIAMLTEFTSEFLNEMLTLNSSVLFLYNKDTDCFEQKKTRKYNVSDFTIANSDNIKNVPLYGGIIRKNFDYFFDDETIKTFSMALTIPLISDSGLVGMFITDGKAVGELSDDDCLIASALMDLFNSSIQRTESHKEIEILKSINDADSFSLFAINRGFREIIGETDPEKLLNVLIEIFAELTKSKYTAFGGYEAGNNSIVIQAYKSVTETITENVGIEFKLKADSYPIGVKRVIDVESDGKLLSQIFENTELFKKIHSKHLVLVIKERILGFVSLSETMTGHSYTQSIFELAESLAILGLISFNNAVLLKALMFQKQSIESQYKHMIDMASFYKI